MHRELIISIIIVVFILGIDYMTQKYTDNAINETIKKLSTIRDGIKQGDVNKERVSDDINKLYNEWLQRHNKLAFFIEHNELEKVETNFVTGKSFIEIEKFEEAVPEIEKTIYVLKHINEKYSVDLKNIF